MLKVKSSSVHECIGRIIHDFGSFVMHAVVLVYVYQRQTTSAPLTTAAPVIFICGGRARVLRTWGPKSPSGVQGEASVGGIGHEVPQERKQFANIVYRFWLQKRSKFEIFAQFTSVTGKPKSRSRRFNSFREGQGHICHIPPKSIPSCMTVHDNVAAL